MHIIYLHQYFVPPEGMGGTRSLEMARRIVRAGHKVTLITSDAYFPKEDYHLNEKVNYLTIEGVNVIVIKNPYSNSMSFTQRICSFLKFAFFATTVALKTEKVDVVFATSTPLTIAIPGIISKKILRCPMVFEVRDLWPEIPIALGFLKNPINKFLARALEKISYANSSHIVALSPGMKEGIIKQGYPPVQITVIPNSSDVELFSVKNEIGASFLELHPFLKGKALLSYAGTIGYVNGLEYLVEIASCLKKLDPEIKIAIVGEGKEKDNIIKKARDKKVLGKNLFILPALRKKDIPALLNASTICSSFVINKKVLWNNSANKFFDALAAGRPILINYLGWQADIIEKYKCGLVVPPDDPIKAAELILNYVLSYNNIREAGENAQKVARTIYDRNVLAEKLIKVLVDNSK